MPSWVLGFRDNRPWPLIAAQKQELLWAGFRSPWASHQLVHFNKMVRGESDFVARFQR